MGGDSVRYRRFGQEGVNVGNGLVELQMDTLVAKHATLGYSSTERAVPTTWLKMALIQRCGFGRRVEARGIAVCPWSADKHHPEAVVARGSSRLVISVAMDSHWSRSSVARDGSRCLSIDQSGIEGGLCAENGMQCRCEQFWLKCTLEVKHHARDRGLSWDPGEVFSSAAQGRRCRVSPSLVAWQTDVSSQR